MIARRGNGVLVRTLRQQGIANETVLDAIASVPRDKFLVDGIKTRARDNDALPIGYGQTTSQPWVIARMLELVLGDKRNLGRVLEVGTGCGYQTALLTHLADEVYSVERLGKLLVDARARLRDAGYPSPRLAHRDGMKGLPEAAPFDTIIVCAATRVVPDALLAQLADNGRLVAPESCGDHELLTLHTRKAKTAHEHVLFVPLIKGTA